MDYCSYFAEKIALSKGEGLVMSKLIKYADKCHQTLNFMTKYLLEEEAKEWWFSKNHWEDCELKLR